MTRKELFSFQFNNAYITNLKNSHKARSVQQYEIYQVSPPVDPCFLLIILKLIV